MFFLPYVYFYITRLKSFSKLISWLCIYALPLLIFGLELGWFNTKQDLLLFLLIVTLIYTLYEVGYIYNDAETIKTEVNPTTRLDVKQLDFFYKNKFSIYCLRGGIALLLSWICLYHFNATVYSILFIWMIIPLYVLYNSTRSILNLPLHFLLVSVRFCAPIFVFGFNLNMLFALLLLFPVINLIERCGEKRFNLKIFQFGLFKNKNHLRVSYYFFVFMLICFVNNEMLLNVGFYSFVYMFLYRGISPFVYNTLSNKLKYSNE